MTIRKMFAVPAGLTLALLVAACGGHTRAATNVESTSATLHGTGVCDPGQSCTAWAEYRQVGTSAWIRTPRMNLSSGTHTRSVHLTGLAPSTTYEYRLCGTQTNVDGGHTTVCFDSAGTGNGTRYSHFRTKLRCPTLLTPDTPPGYCSGTTYWVAPPASGGSDSNPGTRSRPFATIQHAANVVDPGDLVLVQNGTYTGPTGSNSRIVNLNRGGTSSRWVTFKSVNQYGAVLNGQNNSTAHGFWFGRVGYIRIEGFDIHGLGATSGSSSGVTAFDGGNPSQIVGNNIYNIGTGLCTTNTQGLTGVFINQPNVTVESNRIHNIGRLTSITSGGTCTSRPDGTNDHGIYVNGNRASASGALIRNNLLYHNWSGWSVQIFPGTMSNVNVVGNSFYQGNPSRRDSFILLGATLSSSQITNNAFYDAGGMHPGPPLLNHALAGSLTVSHNSTDYSSIIDRTGVATLTANKTSTNPLFVNPPTDFHLLTGSPNIDAGAALPSLLPFDYAGTSRPQGSGFDIGAYER